jgi:hypothetical protein
MASSRRQCAPRCEHVSHVFAYRRLRDLSDEEIKPALTLKHRRIAQFSEQHGVNLEWLLEGRGRIFKADRGGCELIDILDGA